MDLEHKNIKRWVWTLLRNMDDWVRKLNIYLKRVLEGRENGSLAISEETRKEFSIS